MSTNMQMGALLQLDTEDPVDKAITDLVQRGLVECFYHDDMGELCVSLTEKAEKLVADQELDEYIGGDEFQGFLAKAKKVLALLR